MCLHALMWSVIPQVTTSVVGPETDATHNIITLAKAGSGCSDRKLRAIGTSETSGPLGKKFQNLCAPRNSCDSVGGAPKFTARKSQQHRCCRIRREF